MFNFSSFDLTIGKWLILALAAVLIGISKTGVPGLGIVIVPLAASVLPARSSVGLVLVLLIFADIFAVTYYRRHAEWIHILRLMPWVLPGIVAGFFLMKVITDDQLKPIIGGIVLAMLILRAYQQRRKSPQKQGSIHSHWAFAAVLGFIAGLTTMMANAAGPVMIIYLLAMGMPKNQFIGTRAWFFFIVNWIKVPFSSNLNTITAESIKLDLTLFPLIAIGALAGIFILKRIPQKAFNIVIQILAAAAAIKLLL